MTEAAPIVSKPAKPFLRSWWRHAARALVVLGALSLATSCGNGGGSSSAKRTTGHTTTTTAIPPRSGPMMSFGNGSFVVGIQHGDVAPGTYRTRGGSRCYWARLRNGSGNIGQLIVNDNPVGPAIVTIDPTDKAFQSIMCAGWSLMPNSGVPATSFGNGTWAVGTDIAPGTYRAPGAVGCQWERLSAFGAVGTTGVIASDRPPGAATVVIAPTDKGFSSSHCGTWTKIG